MATKTVKAKQGVIFDPFRTIQKLHWGGAPFIEVRGTATPSAAGQAIFMTASFPLLIGSPPTLTLIDSTNPPTTFPAYSTPVTAEELAGTVGGRFTGFTRKVQFNPPPTPPGGAGSLLLKINRASEDFAGDTFRVRIAVTGIENAEIGMFVGTYKNIASGDDIGELDYVGVANDIQSHPTPAAPYDIAFDVNLNTLAVTQV